MWYDAIVIGLGPAGSAAATGLARGGASVLALERAQLGRDKPCGGGLSAKMNRILDPTFHDVVEATVREIRLAFRGREQARFVLDGPVAYMIRRERFDRFLAEQARAAGAEVHDREGVHSVQEDTVGATVVTTRASYRAGFVIGADGVNGVTAQILKPRRTSQRGGRRLAWSLESEVDVTPPVSCALDGAIVIDTGYVPGGYGWIFPKRGRLSVGIAGLTRRLPRPMARFKRFAADVAHVVDAGWPASVRMPRPVGYPIPVFTAGPASSRRIVLVGDAAGLVDPFFGEGIYYAVRSGQLAAEVVSRCMASDGPGLLEYDRRIAEEFTPEFEAARTLARLVYRFPRLWMILLRRHPGAMRLYAQALRGEITLAGFVAEVKRRALAALTLRARERYI